MCVRERVCVWMCVWGRERFKMSWLSWNKNQLSFCWAALQFFFAPAPPQKMQQLAEFVTRHLLFSLFFAFSSLFHQQKKKNCCCRSNIVQVEQFTAFFVCSYFDQNQDQEAEIHTSQKYIWHVSEWRNWISATLWEWLLVLSYLITEQLFLHCGEYTELLLLIRNCSHRGFKLKSAGNLKN